MSEFVSKHALNAGVPMPDLINGYTPISGRYDELFNAEGIMRPHWQRFFASIADMNEADKQRAKDTALHMLKDDGVTHLSYEDEKSTARPWQLDLIPLIMSQPEWEILEAGLVQRAELLNRLLADFYGPQKLINDGAVPPAIVFGSPQFLRAAHGVEIPENRYLHMMAFDLVRSADGTWWVYSDRTQAPTGAGYALENRIIVSHCLPDAFARNNVRRLASFFQAFSDGFLELARKDEPLVVVLSPGPTKETYFEHAYLARYLGYTVVEGADLTVREDKVFLKTVEGLKPVDLIFRRVDSDHCDPLELRPDSYLGVPGLMQAVRDGKVVVGNAIGSGLLESEALMSFLPSLCRTVLGEDLKLPSVATWWCGQENERAYVLDHLNELVVRKVFSARSILAPTRDTYVGENLTPEQRQELTQHIQHRGYDYVGQEPVTVSTAPVWGDNTQIGPAPFTLRVYVAATPDGYRVMPGGLARSAGDGMKAAMEGGSVAQDVWLPWDQPIDQFSRLQAASQSLTLRRSGRDLPSRTADNLFWLGRYMERCEGATRLFRSLLLRLTGEGGQTDVALERLVDLLVGQEHLSADAAKKAAAQGMAGVENELWTILFDPDCPDGIVTMLGNVQRIAELVRERLSLDTWRILDELVSLPSVSRPPAGSEVQAALKLLNTMIQLLSAFNGMAMENMTRGFGWRLLDMGRRVERARSGSRLLRNVMDQDDDEGTGSYDLLLELADSTMTYRTRYKAMPVLPAVLDLLLADETNPRSMVFQLSAVEDHLKTLDSKAMDALLNPAQRIVIGLRTDLRLADMHRLAKMVKKEGRRTNLDRLLLRIENGLSELSDTIGNLYFVHSEMRRVSGPTWSVGEL